MNPEINQEMRDILLRIGQRIAKVLAEIVKWIRTWIEDNWSWLKKAALALSRIEEEKKAIVRQRYRRDFSRKKVSHQVIDCKPRHLIKKIIH